MAHISLREITKSYGDNTVLNGLSLEINDGELISLLGPSGCGKTTLLRTIAGLQDFDSGTIEADGTDVSGLPAQKRPIGMVFQQYSLFPNMTVRENIAFPLESRKMKSEDIRARVDEMVELIGLEQHQNKRPKQLSGGQQQRVALARALAPNPRMLLLDEPLSALDAKVRVRLRDQIRDIQQKVGVTTIFVTHDQAEAFALSDRVVLMHKGEILQAAEPSELYSRPSRIEAARFIGNRNEVELPVRDGRLTWANVFDVPTQLSEGTLATCSFRAERVNVGDEVAHFPNWATARVIRQTYLGAVTQLWLLVESNGAEITATVDGSVATTITNDDVVAVHVNQEDINVYESGQLATR